MKNAYYYLFYKLYKFWEMLPGPKFWSDFKAIVCINILEVFITLSFIIYYSVFINTNSHFGERYEEMVIILLIIIIPNYLIFLHKDQWKGIVHEFDKLPKRKNTMGGIVVWIIIVLIIANLIFACNL